MNKVAQYYRELVASLTERLRNGERDIDALVAQARQRVSQTGELTRTEIEELTRAVRRDLEEFARSYEESQDDVTDSVFMRVIKESLWQELADITDKTQLEWREVFRILIITGFTTAVKWWGLATWCARNVTSIWLFIRRMCCRCVRNADMTSSSEGPLSPK
jgi:hypothetical protein